MPRQSHRSCNDKVRAHSLSSVSHGQHGSAGKRNNMSRSVANPCIRVISLAFLKRRRLSSIAEIENDAARALHIAQSFTLLFLS